MAAFPANHIIEDTGKPFWSGLKRVPDALELNLNDPLHSEFIQAAANIYAAIFNIPLETDKAKVIEIARHIKPTPFVPKANVKIETEEKKNANEQPAAIINEDDEKEIELLVEELNKYSLQP